MKEIVYILNLTIGVSLGALITWFFLDFHTIELAFGTWFGVIAERYLGPLIERLQDRPWGDP